jgi:uncharacterized protein
MKNICFIVIFFFFQVCLFAQVNDGGELTRYFYPNGNISAEGTIRDGKPDDYWKNYYENGVLKSEGNRVYFELDSIWKFYYEDGNIQSEIYYRQDKKNGYAISWDYYYDKDSTKVYYKSSKELFLNGSREGLSYYYSQHDFLQFTFNYKHDKRTGEGKELDKSGKVVTLFNYYNGYLIETTRINRIDENGLKQGRYIDFYENGSKKAEYFYLNDKLHGVYKEFDQNAKLISERRYLNGEIYIPPVEEEVELKAELKKSYHSNGKLQYEGAFLDNTPVGIHKEFNEQGKLVTSKEFTSTGFLLGEGLFDNNGKRTGEWKLFDEYLEYFFGFGLYEDGLKQGKWMFYYPDGNLELEGYYNRDKPDREWTWLFPSGTKKREEVYLDGKREGAYAEYDSVGNTILKGEYFDGVRIGEWYYSVGDITEKGAYEFGDKNGEWKHYYNENNKLRFTGSYRKGEPDGLHKKLKV